MLKKKKLKIKKTIIYFCVNFFIIYNMFYYKHKNSIKHFWLMKNIYYLKLH